MLRRGKIFSPEEAGGIVRELLIGLEVMHNSDLLHRDIKPDNIIFVDGRAKLSDPGLVADATAENSIAGTPGFIPPEMVSDGLPADRKSDLYAMGKLYYCMVIGNAPREYPLLPVSMPFSVRRQIFPALARMCNRNPSKRFSTASEFLKSLPVHIESPGFGERKYADFKDWKNLNQEKFRLFVCLGIAALLLIISGTGGLLFYRWRLAEEIAACRRAAEKFLSVNRDRRELIELQLAAFLPDSLSRYRQLEEKLQKSVKAQEWRRAAAAAGEQQKMLRSSAERLLPEIPKKSGSVKEDFKVAGAARGFLVTPLAAYLPGETLLRFKKALFPTWVGEVRTS